MGLENCQIYFDNPSATYFPGQVVSGRVEFNFSSVKKVRGIYISFKGEAYVHWTESHTHKDSNGKSHHRSVSYNAREEYFSMQYYVIGGSNHDSIELPLGQHVFPFTTTLPNFLPSSFEGEKGYIRYTVKATLDRPWKFNQDIKAAYSVISHLDCNNDARAREPATLSMEKYLCCLCCREGPITGILKLPCTGFVSGQIIPYTLEIDNASKTDVGEIKMKIKKIELFHSHTPSMKTKRYNVTVAEFVVGTVVRGRDCKTFNSSFTLPALPPSNLQNCRIIDLEYQLKVEIEVDGCNKDITGKIPMIIGTIPLTNLVPITTTAPEQASFVSNTESSFRQPLLGWVPGSSTSPAPAPAPVVPFSLPPPTYEECQYGAKSILDDSDSQHTKTNNDKVYAPCYPVYNFNAMPMPPTAHAEGTSMMPVPVHVPSAPVSNVMPPAPTAPLPQ